MLAPQDVVVALKLVNAPAERSYAALAGTLDLSPSQLHAAVARASACGLIDARTRTANRLALREFLVHGLRYVFPAERGGTTRGIPTARAAPPLNDLIVASGDALPVWPDPTGTVRGEAFEPLHRCVPYAARHDAQLYELLALVDAIRGGRARERALAIGELERTLA